jgi:hypothetical protein
VVPGCLEGGQEVSLVRDCRLIQWIVPPKVNDRRDWTTFWDELVQVSCLKGQKVKYKSGAEFLQRHAMDG